MCLYSQRRSRDKQIDGNGEVWPDGRKPQSVDISIPLVFMQFPEFSRLYDINQNIPHVNAIFSHPVKLKLTQPIYPPGDC